MGHFISSLGVQLNPTKISSRLQLPIPTSIKTLRGPTGYYHKFIKNYGSITALLTTLLCTDGFHWDHIAIQAFNKLKQAMATKHVLRLPDFSKTFVIECDASGEGTEAVFMQERLRSWDLWVMGPPCLRCTPITHRSKDQNPTLIPTITYPN